MVALIENKYTVCKFLSIKRANYHSIYYLTSSKSKFRKPLKTNGFFQILLHSYNFIYCEQLKSTYQLTKEIWLIPYQLTTHLNTKQ